MAVITIDAKAELAQIQAAIDAESAQEAPPPSTSEAASEPATKEADAAEKREPAADDEPPDFAKQLGLTAEQHKAITSIFDKKIGKKVRETREAEEFAAAQYTEKKLAESRAAALEQEIAKLRESQPAALETTPDLEAGKPIREKFDSDQAYWDAYVDWRAERMADAKIKKKEANDAKAAAERRQAEILETAKARIGKALELVPDFKTVTEAADLEVPPAVAGYMQKSEMFAELGYHLAKNPDILKSLAKLEPDQQLVTIGKIESTLKPFGSSGSKDDSGATPSSTARSSGQPANGAASSEEAGISPSRARSSAPVITPLNGNGATGSQVEARDMNTREMIADWQKRNRANLGLRKRH